MQGVLTCSCSPLFPQSLLSQAFEKQRDGQITLNLHTNFPIPPQLKRKGWCVGHVCTALAVSVSSSSLVARGVGGRVVYRTQEEILSFGEVRVAGTHLQNSRGTKSE